MSYKVVRRVMEKGVLGTSLKTTTHLDIYHPNGGLFEVLELHGVAAHSNTWCAKILQAFFGHDNWYIEGDSVTANAYRPDPFEHELPEQKTAVVHHAGAVPGGHTFLIKFVANHQEHTIRLDRDINPTSVLQLVAAYMSILDVRHPWKAEHKLTPERAFAALEAKVTDPEAKSAIRALRGKAKESGWI